MSFPFLSNKQGSGRKLEVLARIVFVGVTIAVDFAYLIVPDTPFTWLLRPFGYALMIWVASLAVPIFKSFSGVDESMRQCLLKLWIMSLSLIVTAMLGALYTVCTLTAVSGPLAMLGDYPELTSALGLSTFYGVFLFFQLIKENKNRREVLEANSERSNNQG